MKTETVRDAIEMARLSRGNRFLRLRCHSDVGSQFRSVRNGGRPTEIGGFPSVGNVGSSFYDPLGETVNGYCKPELLRGLDHRGPWEGIEELELAKLGWVHWLNNSAGLRIWSLKKSKCTVGRIGRRQIPG